MRCDAMGRFIRLTAFSLWYQPAQVWLYYWSTTASVLKMSSAHAAAYSFSCMYVQATLGGLWAPNTYKLLDVVSGSDTICSGAAVYATVTGGCMVRKEFAEENPMTVAKVLAGWLRAVHFINMKSNKEEVLDYMTVFYAENNVVLPRSSLELDLSLVGLFELEQQLDLMTRRGSPPLSTYDIWTNEVGKFLNDNGVIESVPDPTTFIDDTYMQMVKSDKLLEDWALGNDPAATSASSPSLGFHHCHFVVLACLVLLTFPSVT
jgi:hypothetical protein